MLLNGYEYRSFVSAVFIQQKFFKYPPSLQNLYISSLCKISYLSTILLRHIEIVILALYL